MKLLELQSPAEITQLEQQLDQMFSTLGLDVEFSRHFVERLLGRERGVTGQDVLASFDNLKKKYKQRLLAAKKQNKYEAILKDFDRDLNIVFGIRNTKQGPELINITIKRKNPDEFHANASGGDELTVGRRK